MFIALTLAASGLFVLTEYITLMAARRALATEVMATSSEVTPGVLAAITALKEACSAVLNWLFEMPVSLTVETTNFSPTTGLGKELEDEDELSSSFSSITGTTTATMIVVTNEELEALGTEDVLEADDGDDGFTGDDDLDFSDMKPMDAFEMKMETIGETATPLAM